MKKIVLSVFLILGFWGTSPALALQKIKPAKVFSVTDAGHKYYCFKKGGKQLSVIKKGKKYVLGKDAIKQLEASLRGITKPSAKKKLKALKSKVRLGNIACKNSGTGDDNTPGSASLAKLARALTGDDIRYLLDKAALGQSSREADLVSAGLNSGIDQLVDQLMQSHNEPVGLNQTVLNLLDGQLDQDTTQTPSGQRAGLLYQWINTNNPFQEKFALALLSIWTVAGDVISDETFRHAWWNYYNLLRDYAYGDTALPSLAVQITKDPLMLTYLNNELNLKNSPNENYARELLELFTVGPRDLDGNANYTETQIDGSGDIAVAARMLTGWKVNKDYIHNELVADYSQRSSRHQNGPHIMFAGKPYQFTGEDYQDLVEGIFAHHPAAQNYYATELLKLYVSPRPPRALIEAFGSVIKSNDFNLTRSMKILLKSEAFFDPVYRDSVPMNSFEFAAKTARILEMFNAVNANEGQRSISLMGMEVNMAPSVFWYNPKVWVSASVGVEKGNYLSGIMDDSTYHAQGGWSAAKIMPTAKLTKAEFVDNLINRVGLSELSQKRLDSIISYLSLKRNSDGTFQAYTFDNQNPAHQRFKGMGVYYLLFLTPEFNLL